MSAVHALVFDLDGTLVQTEALKADSYHAVLSRLLPELTAAQVREAYAAVVGRSGEEVVRSLIEAFPLPADFAAQLDPAPGEAPWETLYRVRKGVYAQMLDQPERILDASCPYNRAALSWARSVGLPVGLATMSHRAQTARVLGILGIADAFDVILTRDDVAHGKPNPEIYHRAFEALNTTAAHTLILEDSPSGARAAVASGAQVLVVVNGVTRSAVARAGLEDMVVDIVNSDPDLLGKVQGLIAASMGDA